MTIGAELCTTIKCLLALLRYVIQMTVQQQRKSDARQHSSSSINSSSARRRAVRQTWEPGGAGASLIPSVSVEGGLAILQQNGTSADAYSINSSTQGTSLAAAAVAPLQESAALAAARAVHRQLYAQHCAVFKELLQWCCSSGATTADGGTAAAVTDRLAQVSVCLHI
jgi:hypothetical protein